MASNQEEVIADLPNPIVVPPTATAPLTTKKSYSCGSFLTMFSCTNIKRKADLDGDGDVDVHDFGEAVDILIAQAGKTGAEANRLINLANAQVNNIILWLTAAKIVVADDTELCNNIDAAITMLRGFSLLVNAGQAITTRALSIPMPTNAIDLGNTITDAQETLTLARSLLKDLQSENIKIGITPEQLEAVSDTLTKVSIAQKFMAMGIKSQSLRNAVTLS